MKTKLLYESPAFLLSDTGTLRDILDVSGEVVEDLTENDIFTEAYGDHFS